MRITCLVSADQSHLQQVRQVMVEMEATQRRYLNHWSGKDALCSLRLTLEPTIVRPCPAGIQLDEEVL